MGSVMVCGFYTEDYRRWLIPLVASLDQLGQAHDIVPSEKARCRLCRAWGPVAAC
jgi:hypothetical protein